MSAEQNPAAPDHLPAFLSGPEGSDPLMVVTGIILIAAVLGVGLLFLRLHTMPERIAHRGHKLQFEIVAVLGLLALFTHMHLFWVAGLLLALIDIPDFLSPMHRIAGSSERIAGSAERLTGQPPDQGDASERPQVQAAEAAPEPRAGPAAEPAPVREH
jgi:hypothetical protein